jgi:hypothetical protein
MSQHINTFNVEKFKNTALFAICLRKWGNRAKVKDPAKLAAYLAELAKVDGNAAPPMIEGSTSTKRVSANKVLVKSEALEATNTFLNDTKKQCLALCMPSCIREGMFVASLVSKSDGVSPVAQINEIMAAAVAKLESEYLPELEIELPQVVEAAKRSPVRLKDEGGYELDPNGGLGPLYDDKDYPRLSDGTLDTEKILAGFGIEWNWLALTVPEGLPPELRQAETEKLQQQFADAATEVRDALRVMFAKLVTHATEALKTEPGEKKKIFRDTLVGNLSDFFATFEHRNIMGDEQLAAVVAQCRAVMLNGEEPIDPDALRKDDALRDLTAKKLDEIKGALAPLVAECASRQFTLEE